MKTFQITSRGGKEFLDIVQADSANHAYDVYARKLGHWGQAALTVPESKKWCVWKEVK